MMLFGWATPVRGVLEERRNRSKVVLVSGTCIISCSCKTKFLESVELKGGMPDPAEVAIASDSKPAPLPVSLVMANSDFHQDLLHSLQPLVPRASNNYAAKSYTERQ